MPPRKVENLLESSFCMWKRTDREPWDKCASGAIETSNFKNLWSVRFVQGVSIPKLVMGFQYPIKVPKPNQVKPKLWQVSCGGPLGDARASLLL